MSHATFKTQTMSISAAAGLLYGLADMTVAMYRRSCERSALASLDNRLLDDIGISPAAADAETGKPFWRV